ncbi:MAG TPA: T9SS type A sorting domain-containing protein, partial [Parafilimonas sp.]|nr:T9SS type A sorting domain-containing protein [Parafilimonas sp.]
DNATSLQQTTDGGYVLGGWSQSGIGGDKTEESRGSDDYWIVKMGCPPNTTVTPSGTLDICQKDFLMLHAYSADGCKYQWIKDNKIILGATDSMYASTRPGIYRVLVYTRKLCADISKPIKIISSCNRSNDISIYPNPSHGNVTLTYNSTNLGSVQLNVYDKTGRMMLSKIETAIEGSNTYRLDLSRLINGVYSVQVINRNDQSQVTVVIEK